MRGFVVGKAGIQKRPGFHPPLFSWAWGSAARKMSACRAGAVSPGAVRDAGAVTASELEKISRLSYLFCYNSFALAGDFPASYSSKQDATVSAVAFCLFGAVTLCQSSQPWVGLGHLGSNWVDIGGGGRRAERHLITDIPRTETKGLTADER